MPKSDAQKRAEQAHRERTVQVQVRFTLEEAAAIDATRGRITRPQWVKAKALAASKARQGRIKQPSERIG